MANKIYDFEATTIDGKIESLSTYSDNVLLIINTASKCGFTKQFEGLQKLYDQYSSKGFTILGFPCNQFSEQEPGDEEEIKSFCSLNYNVTFPMFSKIDVNGDNAHPLFEFLKGEANGILSSDIKWNFTKFLVNKDGKVVKRFSPSTEPGKIEKHIQKLL